MRSLPSDGRLISSSMRVKEPLLSKLGQLFAKIGASCSELGVRLANENNTHVICGQRTSVSERLHTSQCNGEHVRAIAFVAQRYAVAPVGIKMSSLGQAKREQKQQKMPQSHSQGKSAQHSPKKRKALTERTRGAAAQARTRTSERGTKTSKSGASSPDCANAGGSTARSCWRNVVALLCKGVAAGEPLEPPDIRQTKWSRRDVNRWAIEALNTRPSTPDLASNVVKANASVECVNGQIRLTGRARQRVHQPVHRQYARIALSQNQPDRTSSNRAR